MADGNCPAFLAASAEFRADILPRHDGVYQVSRRGGREDLGKEPPDRPAAEIRAEIRAERSPPSQAAPASPGPRQADNDVSAGRSIYYGAVLYAGSLVGGLWVPVLFQLVCAATAVWLTLDAVFGPGERRSFPVVLGLLGLMTPLSFYIAYLMPDVFAGIAILAVANLIAFDREMRPGIRLVWFLLLAAAIVFHTSHLAIALVLLVPVAALAVLLTRRLPGRASPPSAWRSSAASPARRCSSPPSPRSMASRRCGHPS